MSILREMRRSRGLHLQDVAGLVDTTTSTVSRWETGTATPPTEKIAALLDAMDATPAERRAVWTLMGVPSSDLAHDDLTEAAP